MWGGTVLVESATAPVKSKTQLRAKGNVYFIWLKLKFSINYNYYDHESSNTSFCRLQFQF